MSIFSNILLFSGENTFVAGKVVGLKRTNRTVETADDSISFKITFDFEDVKNPEKKPRQNVGVFKTNHTIIKFINLKSTSYQIALYLETNTIYYGHCIIIIRLQNP